MSDARPLRLAMTETRNAYAAMPERIEALPTLADHLDAIRDANVAHNVALIEAAAGAGADVVLLSEFCTGPYFALSVQAFWREMAEDAHDGPSVLAFAAAAARAGVVVVAPIYERCPRTGERHDTAVVIDADGTRLGCYRKLHVPDGTNEQATFSEAFYYRAPGEPGPIWRPERNVSRHPLLPVFATAKGRIGVSICYDRHFDGVHRALARNGAELVLCPAVTFGAKSERMWWRESEVDAVRHRIFLGVSNRLGEEAPWNQPFFGQSHVMGPEGPVSCSRELAGLVLADVDLATLHAVDPSGWQLDRDRRDEDYERDLCSPAKPEPR
ncbi:MAG: hypothetical protein RIT45_1529 [Pseudomonadota bacterium]|jgi:N-carbamoylputrescine amidase